MTTRPGRGFTLLEVMVALVVMIIASVGVVVGLMAASRELRVGQLRLHKATLLDASAQRIRLQNKVALTALGIAPPSTPPAQQAIGTGNWVKDPIPMAAGDLSTGAFFRMLPNGEFTQLPDSTATDCAPASLPKDVYCRERMIVLGGPTADAGLITAGGAIATVWFRVSRASEPPVLAVLSAEVIAP